MKQRHNPWIKTSLAWRWVKYWKEPARPLKQELKYIKDLALRIKMKSKNPQVLILGSTSEYRDLMIDLGIKATVVDFWPENYRILSHRMKHFKQYKNYEIYMRSKWQILNVGEKFDLVIGHFALNVIPFGQWEKIIKNIRKHLKDSGVFLTNCWVRFDNQIPNIKEIVDEYQKRWKDKYGLWQAMMAKLYLSAYDVNKEWMTYPELSQIIENSYKEKMLLEKDYKDYLQMGYKYYNFRLVIPNKKMVIELFKKYFNLKKLVYFDYPCYKYMPDFYLVNK